jgi:hypothetical protein
MTKAKVIQIAATLSIAYFLFLLLFLKFGNLYFDLFKGVFRYEIETLYPEFEVSSLRIENRDGKEMIFLWVNLTDRTIQARTLLHKSPGTAFGSGTMCVDQYIHPIVMLSVLLAWPVSRFRNRLYILLLALPFLFLLEMADVPVLLAVRCMESFNSLAAPKSALGIGSFWVSFLHTGGRQALSVISACCAVGLFHAIKFWGDQRKLSGKEGKPRRNEPCPCGSGLKYKKCCLIR